MIVALCVEDSGGMLFNNRRVSRDRIQQEDLLRLCEGKKLWMHSFSGKLFSWAAEQVMVDDAFMERAASGEICFVENQPLQSVADQIEGVILYRWNRAYPSDMKLDLNLSDFVMTEQTEFPGASHETITREIYVKK